jgi:1-acyl-sn-glycerol-3-phosphate acyltransferase
MITSKRQSLPLWFFTTFFRLMQKIFFREVEFKLDKTVPDGSVLLLQNHFSWWDGYWSYFISEKLLKRRFHVMMLEKELKRRMFLIRTGAFSVDPGGKEMLATLRYASGLLSNPGNVVTIYPQGEIQSHYIGHVSFQKGASTLLKLAGENVHVVFAAAHIQYGSPVRPKAHIHLQYFGSGSYSAKELEAAYNKFYSESRAEVVLAEI